MTTTLAQLPHWIGGRAQAGASGRDALVHDPALGRPVRTVPLASAEEIDAAIDAATTGFGDWSSRSTARRQTVLFRFRELLNERRGDLARLITEEHGKVIADAEGEVARGLEVVDFALGFPSHLKGGYAENVSTGVDVYSLRQPLGVVAIIGPFNFPAMVPLWFVPIALAAGNAVVLKPSEKVPSAALWIAELLEEAGLPDGAFSVVHGDRVAVDALLDHPGVSSISFVGSTPIAKYIYRRAAENGKRVQAFGGAKNHMLVLPDADIDLVADAAVNAGFGSAGERCMAISALTVVESVADDVVRRIAERVSRLRVGDGRRGCDMGPLITREHRDRVADYIQTALDDGAHVIVDGRELEVDGDSDGFWLGPTLIDRVPLTSSVYRDEIFGPVLSVIRVASYQDGVDLINASPYANGAAIFTNDGGAARRFQNEVSAGMIGVNVPIPVPVGYFSFGGAKDSLFGDTKAYGEAGFHFFTREKTVTSRWADPSARGVDLGFPQNG